MRKLPLSRGILFFLNELEFIEAALTADEDAKHLAIAIMRELEGFEGLFARQRAAARAVVRAEAVVAVRNQQLDRETMEMAKLARALAADILDRIFSHAPSKFIRGPLRKQCELTINLIAVELGKLPDSHPLKPYALKLTALAQAALEALDVRAEAKGTRQSVSNDIDEWKEGINALRTTLYAELLKIATAKNYPKTWVEAFFRQQPSRKAAEPDEDDDGDGEGSDE